MIFPAPNVRGFLAFRALSRELTVENPFASWQRQRHHVINNSKTLEEFRRAKDAANAAIFWRDISYLSKEEICHIVLECEKVDVAISMYIEDFRLMIFPNFLQKVAHKARRFVFQTLYPRTFPYRLATLALTTPAAVLQILPLISLGSMCLYRALK